MGSQYDNGVLCGRADVFSVKRIDDVVDAGACIKSARGIGDDANPDRSATRFPL
jgi:hypothetical protein